MIDTKQKQLLYVAGGVGISAGTLLFLRHLYKRYQYWNSPLVKAGTVQDLMIFPLKSAKGHKVQWLDCDIRGPSYNELKDRHFIVVDAKTNNTVMTARQYPKLELLSTKVENGALTIADPDGNSVMVDIQDVVGKKKVLTAVLFEKKQEGLDCGEEVGHFLSTYLKVGDKREIKLVYFIDGLYTERNFVTESKLWFNPVPKLTDYVSLSLSPTPYLLAAFQDQASYHLLTQASVDELNSRLQQNDPPKTVTHLNFRPNILVEGTPAFDEDQWLEIHIGEAEFLAYQPCTRCILPTVDPEAGELDKHAQPLKKLREYRLLPGKLRQVYTKDPAFGLYMALKKPGRIHVGDDVIVRYKPTPF